MHPRTLALVAVALLGGALALRVVVVRFGLLPISDEVVLKKAVALKINYYDRGQLKTHEITDPAQVQEALATLKIKANDFGTTTIGPNRSAEIQFCFPNGTNRNLILHSPGDLGDNEVAPAFFQKLTEIVSRHEGHVVDLTHWPPHSNVDRDALALEPDPKK